MDTNMTVTPEQEKQISLISEIVKEEMKIPEKDFSIKPLDKSKHDSYVIKTNYKKYKAKVFPEIPTNLHLHKHLEECGFECPKIVVFHKKHGRFVKIQEWIEGRDIRDLTGGKLEFDYIEDWVFTRWGEYMGKLHNIEYNGAFISINDMFWFNFIVTPENKVVCCDMSKLYEVNFPEHDIFTWILFNLMMPNKKKECFIDGYLSVRNMEYCDQLAATQTFMNKIRHLF